MNETVRLIGKRVIFFDVNQTLVQQNLSFEDGFRRVWENFIGRWSRDEKPSAEQVWTQYITRWQQRKKSRITFQQLDELQQQCLQEAMEAMDIPVSGAMKRGFIQEIRRLQVEAKTMPPHTREVLERLSRNYRLAIISNSPRSEVLLMLKRFDIGTFFPPEHVFTALKPADKKPAPYLFKKALKTMQFSPKQAVMVGNSWRHDVCGAVKAGLDAVWLSTSGSAAGPDAKKITQQRLGKRKVYLIKRLDQLSELFS
ncbi:MULTISPECIES: HAD family hydrolase [unclassified Paenibacillus]|uniref:HAD family hydrolase n=1 Tax=unclassified Paenibacillus TaxID=185978 RepID=UPI002118E41E|nr:MULTISPECIES: HAD family hydrolase [unclassified Paenibacillus]